MTGRGDRRGADGAGVRADERSARRRELDRCARRNRRGATRAGDRCSRPSATFSVRCCSAPRLPTRSPASSRSTAPTSSRWSVRASPARSSGTSSRGRWGMPSSSGHALIGGLVGAAIADAGLNAVNWGGLDGIKPVGVFGSLIYLAIAPVAGFAAGFTLERVLLRSLARATDRVRPGRARGPVVHVGDAGVRPRRERRLEIRGCRGGRAARRRQYQQSRRADVDEARVRASP